MSQFAPFPDQKYINHVRDTLRSPTSFASVMIGSGFSKFAAPVRSGVGELPLWGELANEIFEELNRLSPRQRRYQPNGTALDQSISLSLAQEYLDTFGRSSLHRFLQHRVRDDDFKPGEFHKRLLRLPWRDVFTTNWDTLLERARMAVPKPSYAVVRNKNDIPLSTQPRIVKLHGSIDGHFPLIATEKDFITYPQCHAPLANTARQALMESVFCLIGFSGNDPNFLEWSSWVQENLGVGAPRIYVAGWLELSAEQREFFEARKIVAIDLARHPQARNWPTHLQHKYAVNWILNSLENWRDFDVAEWSTPDAQALHDIPAEVQPGEVVTSVQPLKQPTSPSISDDPQEIENSIRKALPIWAHNRQLYQGWLMAPIEIRRALTSTINEWQSPILRVLDGLSPIEQLNALRELTWLSEITLEPISPELESAALASLALIDCEAHTVKGNLEPDLSWSEIRDVWREVALTLLTTARFRLDQKSFLERMAMLSPFHNDDPDVGHRINHEKCLWAALSSDFEALEGRLKEWKTRDGDPMWMLRKAALLSEAGREEESKSLTHQAITEIRRVPVRDQSVWGPSREGWALWSEISFENRQEVFNRWSQLAALRCDAHAEKAEVVDSLRTSDKLSDAPDFDPGVRRATSTRFGVGGALITRKAYRAIRLSEIAGIPVATPDAFPSRANGADLLELAAVRVVKLNPELAVRLVLRACTYDKDDALIRVLSRNSIALTPHERVRSLVADCTRLIDYGLPRGWIEHIRVAVEVLSQLASRLDGESARELFKYGMNLYRDRHHPFASHTWISAPLRNLLRRTWAILSRDQQAGHAIELLAAPIVGLDDFDLQFPDRHPDPGDLFSEHLEKPFPSRNAESEAQWHDVLKELLRALRVAGAPRIRATNRLLPLAEEGILTESEKSEFASALWDKDHAHVDGLPECTQLHDWAFVLLPEPMPGLAARRFHKRWLSERAVKSRIELFRSGATTTVSLGTVLNDPSRLEDTLWNVGNAIGGLRHHARSLDLADAERGYLVDLISQWVNTPIQVDTDNWMRSELESWTSWALRGIGFIFSEVDIPRPVCEALFERLKSLTESGLPTYGSIGGLVRLIPDRTVDLTTWLRIGLASDKPGIATAAASGLACWLRLSNAPNSLIQVPQDEVIREMGLIIGARRKAPLSEALQVATWVFDNGNDHLREIILDSVLHGLNYVVEELRYDRHVVSDDTPDLRLRCAELASSMAKAGLEEAPAVARWLELASKDPFADVRNAVARDSGS